MTETAESAVRNIHDTAIVLETVSALYIRDWGWIEVKPGSIVTNEDDDIVFFLDDYGRLNGFEADAILGSRWNR